MFKLANTPINTSLTFHHLTGELGKQMFEGEIAVEFYFSVIEFHKYKTLKWFALTSEKNQFSVAVEKSVCQAKQVASR